LKNEVDQALKQVDHEKNELQNSHERQKTELANLTKQFQSLKGKKKKESSFFHIDKNHLKVRIILSLLPLLLFQSLSLLRILFLITEAPI